MSFAWSRSWCHRSSRPARPAARTLRNSAPICWSLSIHWGTTIQRRTDIRIHIVFLWPKLLPKSCERRLLWLYCNMAPCHRLSYYITNQWLNYSLYLIYSITVCKINYSIQTLKCFIDGYYYSNENKSTNSDRWSYIET